MTIRKARKNEKIVIDLNGPQGNAFYLIGILKSTFARSGARDLGDQIAKQMMEGDYEHLIETFDMHLGDYYDLVR